MLYSMVALSLLILAKIIHECLFLHIHSSIHCLNVVLIEWEVRWYLTWLWFAFSWWLLILRIFFIYLLFTCISSFEKFQLRSFARFLSIYIYIYINYWVFCFVLFWAAAKFGVLILSQKIRLEVLSPTLHAVSTLYYFFSAQEFPRLTYF